MADFDEYLNQASEPSEYEDEVIGTLVKCLSPREQGLKKRARITLKSGKSLKVNTAWQAHVVDDQGELHLWRWPAYIDADGESRPAKRIIRPVGTKLSELKKGQWHFFKDENNRSHIERA